jgi:hypothetical protein
MQRGKPPHKPTEKSCQEVLKMAGLGLTQQQISAVKGISVPTLAKHYRAELDTGTALASARVCDHLFDIATTDRTGAAVNAAIFWLKSRAGWRDVQQVEHGRANEFDRMTDEELIEIVRQEARKLGFVELKTVTDTTATKRGDQ